MAPTRKTGRASRRAGSPPPPISRTQPQTFRACSPVRERVRGRSDTGALSLSDLGSVGGGLVAALGGRGARDSKGSAGTLTGSDEEGIRLLRQQLSAVKRIRVEHERKDAAIAALQVEVSKLSRDKEETVALQHECGGMRVRLAGLEEWCRQLETAERDSSHRWTRKEDTWRSQIRDAEDRLQAAQEQTREERDRAERLAAAKANLEPALAAADARARTAEDTAAREHAGRAEAELRASNAEGVLDAELEEERAKVRDLEGKMKVLKKEIAVSRDEVESLAPRMKNLEEVNDALRNRCSEAELELVQLNVYWPLVERADLIDRRRTEAEEGLRAAEAELGREKASSEAAKRNAAELQAALDRHGARLAKAEFEASKALSLEREIFSLTHRLEVAEADKEKASRARRSDEEAHRAVATALEELVDLATEPTPRQQKTPPVPTGRVLPKEGGGAALARGGVAGAYGARWEHLAETSTLVTRLAELEASMRRRAAGKDGGDEPVDEERCGVGKGPLRGGDGVNGSAELRRAVRAVRALAESVASVAGDRDRCVDEVVRARAESRSLDERVEALLRENKSSAKALENASASRFVLLSRLRDAQVSRLAAEAAAEKAGSELSEVRHFLASISETLSRSSRTEEGTGDSEGSPRKDSSAFAKTSPTEHGGNWGAAGGAALERPSSARLISDVSAGVKGLLVARSAAADAIRGLENRCCRTEKQLEELHSLARDRDAVHGEQLAVLRNRCEAEMDTRRQAEKAAQGTAERALRDMGVALKKISAFEKNKSRISSRVADVNDRLSTLSAEASAAMAGLRLLARACAPLIERCRLLATQRRLVARLSVDFAPIIRASTLMAEPDIDALHLMDGLRALVATLDRCDKRKRADARCGEWQADARRRESGGGEATSEKVCENLFREAVVPTPSYRPPLVSLRAVGIAAVAARRLVRLAVLRASRRAASTQEMTCSPMRRIEQPGCSPGIQRESQSHNDCDGNDVIPLGPLGGTGGVSMLCEGDVSFVLPATVLAGAEASGGGQSAAARCLGLLDALVRCRGSDPGARGSGEDEEPSLLQVLVQGQAGHWRRLEQRGLVPARRLASWGSCRGEELRGGHRGTDRIILGRIARHYGNEWMAWRRRIMGGESLRLMEVTRRGVSALARCVEDSERRFAESEARRHRVGTELGIALESAKELRTELDKKCEMVSFFEERVHILEREAAGTVPVEAFSSTEKALAESLAEVEKWRVRSASLEAELEEALDMKKATRRARRGAEIAYKEQAVRAQLQDELLSLRSYVLRSEQAVQELQEEARRQARETGRRGILRL